MLIETKILFHFDEAEKKAFKTVINCLKEIARSDQINNWDAYASECLTNIYHFMNSTPDGERFWQNEIVD